MPDGGCEKCWAMAEFDRRGYSAWCVQTRYYHVLGREHGQRWTEMAPNGPHLADPFRL